MDTLLKVFTIKKRDLQVIASATSKLERRLSSGALTPNASLQSSFSDATTATASPYRPGLSRLASKGSGKMGMGAGYPIV